MPKPTDRTAYRKQYKQTPAGIYGVILYSAKLRDLPVSMSKDEFSDWWTHHDDVCSYCGIGVADFLIIRDLIVTATPGYPSLAKYKKIFSRQTQKAVGRMTIDRIDNLRGYSLDNIAKCCLVCNVTKSNLLDKDEMLMVAESIKDDFDVALVSYNE